MVEFADAFFVVKFDNSAEGFAGGWPAAVVRTCADGLRQHGRRCAPTLSAPSWLGSSLSAPQMSGPSSEPLRLFALPIC